MRDFFAHSLPQNPLLLALLLAFVAIFCAAVLWQLLPSRRPEQERLARLPLQD